MKKLVLILFFALFLASLFSIRATKSFFTDTEKATGNILSVATEFSTTPSPTPTPAQQPGDVVINEINWSGSSLSTADEWVELKNMTSNPIDISGWVIENLGESSSPNITISSGSIPANGFFLISNNVETSSKINIVPDFVTTSISLANEGEQLRLKSNTNVLIDSANSTSGGWFTGEDPSPGPAKSMERNDSPGDGTVAGNWHTATSQTNMDGDAAELATPRVANSTP